MSALSDSILARLDEIEARLDTLEAKVPKCKAFVAPQVETVYGYFTEHGGSRLMADDFFDFYASKGWMVGKVKMKEWERAASRWIRNNKPVATVIVEDRKPQDVKADAMLNRTSEVVTRMRAHEEAMKNGGVIPMPAELSRRTRPSSSADA